MAAAPVSPVDTLVEETILKIFGKLSDTDLTTCFRACPQWRQWLMNKSTRFLFPEVAPHILKELPKDKLLKYRRVCKPWRDALDNAYQAQYSKDFQYPADALTNHFESTDMITNFLQDMHSHPGNPFPGRNVVLEWDFPKDIDPDDIGNLDNLRNLFEAFWNNSVVQLLNMFGHQVHFVTIDFERMDWFEERVGLTHINILQVLQRILERLPYLKQLEIRAVTFPEADEWDEAMRMIRLPQLENLVTVEIVGPPDYFVQSILQSCCDPNKIKRVGLFPIGGGFANFVYGFQNLEVLDTASVSLEVIERFHTLERRPPLRKVVLGFSDLEYVDWRRLTDFKRLFTTLELFSDTLKDIKLITSYSAGEEAVSPLNNEMKGIRVNLPKLENLSWVNYVGPLDPFLKLPSLKHLNFKVTKLQHWGGSAVQLYGFEEEMETSNIWSLIPSLKTFTIAGKDNESGSFNKKYHRLLQGIICENMEEDETNPNENESSNNNDMDVDV